MCARHYDLHGFRVVELAAEGNRLANDRDAVDAMAAASAYQPEIMVIPVERLDESFFRLRTGVAGQIIQKFLTYRKRLVIVGDISQNVQDSSALRDFVYECNSGSDVWFVAGIEEFHQRLQTETGGQ